MTCFWIDCGFVYPVKVVMASVTSRIVAYTFCHDHRVTYLQVMEHGIYRVHDLVAGQYYLLCPSAFGTIFGASTSEA
jgi:hypothetical protein